MCLMVVVCVHRRVAGRYSVYKCRHVNFKGREGRQAFARHKMQNACLSSCLSAWEKHGGGKAHYAVAW